MIDAVVSEHMNAPPDRVRALYRDPEWARLFPATIRGARVVRRERDATVVEVDHVEGKVVNILRDTSSTRIDLVEFKRRHDATFVNEFIGKVLSKNVWTCWSTTAGYALMGAAEETSIAEARVTLARRRAQCR